MLKANASLFIAGRAPAFAAPIAGLLALLLCGRGGDVWGQQPAERFRESVSVETDLGVARILVTVREHLAEQQWDRAIGLLDELQRDHGGSLVEAAPGRYMSCRLYCTMLLSELPPPALEAYRARHDPVAGTLWEQGLPTRSAAPLEQILRAHYNSSYGDDALLALGDWAFERGEFSRAALYWRQLLPGDEDREAPTSDRRLSYPNTDLDAASIEARLVLCAIFERSMDARNKLREFERRWPEAEGELAGRRGRYWEILDEVHEEAQTWASPPQPGDHLTFAGNAQRNGARDQLIDVGAEVWSQPLGQPFGNLSVFLNRRPALGLELPLSYFPVVANGKVFVNNARYIYAWDLATGRPAWPLENDDSAIIYSPSEPEPFPQRETVGAPRFTMTIHGDRLFAKMGTPITARTRQDLSRSTSELVCLDIGRGEGKLLWKVSAEEFSAGESRWAFEGSPVYADGRLFVALRRSHPQTQTNVACYDPETGRLIWNQKVCAAVANIGEAKNYISHLLLTCGDGFVFLATNQGAVAALHARDGSLQWIHTYESETGAAGTPGDDPLAGSLVPCVYDRGRLFAAPRDTSAVRAFDALSGQVLWSQQLPEDIHQIVGVRNGQVYLGGHSLWGLEAATGRVTFGQPLRDPELYGYGRALLVGETVWWPTRDSIEIRSQRNGARTWRQPIQFRKRGPAASARTGGNLLISGDRLIVAQSDRLVVYSSSPVPGETPNILPVSTPESVRGVE